MEPSPNRCWGLLRRRQCLVPTWRGCALVALLAAALALVATRTAYPFLAPNEPAPGGVLVVEGWVSDSILKVALAEFQAHHYERLLVTGIPLDRGAPLSEYTNYAYLGAAVLVKLGLSSNDVVAVPTAKIERDRTYAMALSLKTWLRENHIPGGNVNLVTHGPHGRRSRMLFQKALGPSYTVGVQAVPEQDFDERHWWRSSQGFRSVVGEALAYAYARLLFHPPRE
jgi:uncharacterized SAM-binding protein YcdF (DUF218 family)